MPGVFNRLLNNVLTGGTAYQLIINGSNAELQYKFTGSIVDTAVTLSGTLVGGYNGGAGSASTIIGL